MKNKGVALLSVLVFSIILGISISAFVFLTSSEVGAVKRQNNTIRALYAAEAGVERMYVTLKKAKTMSERQALWDCNPAGCSYAVNGNIGGCSYQTAATTRQNAGINIMVNSAGSTGNITTQVVVVYNKGPKDPFEGFSSGMDIDLHGRKVWFLPIWVNVNAPPGALFANGSINVNEYTNVQGTQVPGADVPLPQFLETMLVDTDGDGTPDTERWVDLDGTSPASDPNANDSDCNHYYDTNGDGDPINALADADRKGPDNSRRDNNEDGRISKGDNPFVDDPENPEDNYDLWNTEFDSDDVDSNGEITEKDGFVYYYTETVNNQDPNYEIGVGQDNYYSGDTYFGPAGEHVNPDVNIVFVDGDVDMLFGGASYYWWDSNLTVVATGDVTMYAPINQEEDHLNIVSYGNIQSNSNLFNLWDGFYVNMYAHGSIDINAGDWGVSRGIFGSMVANQGIDIGDLLLLSRHVSYDDWILGDGNMAGRPLFPYVPAELKIGSKISWQRE